MITPVSEVPTGLNLGKMNQALRLVTPGRVVTSPFIAVIIVILILVLSSSQNLCEGYIGLIWVVLS